MEIGETQMKTEEVLAGIGIVVGLAGLVAQLNAPHCPQCGTKLIIINHYCVNCQVSWSD